MVTLLLGDNPQCYKDIELSLQMSIPIVILEGSEFAKEVFAVQEGTGAATGTMLKKEAITKLAKSNFIRCKESSEDLASILHLILAITLF